MTDCAPSDCAHWLSIKYFKSLQIEGLPTIVFIPKEADKPALRTEGLLPAAQIIDIVRDMGKPQEAN